MSNWLSRPLIIDYNSCSFQFPNLRLEDSATHPGLPSPFIHIMLMGQLIRTLSTKLKTEEAVMSSAEVLNMQEEIKNWINALPPAYRVDNPDTSWDKGFWYVNLQRNYLHGMTFMVKLHPLKSYLAKESDGELSVEDQGFRSMGVDCCLKLLDACQHLYDLEPSYSAKFHLVIFCTFDSATVLCAAVLHDKRKDLPQRPVVLEAIGSALRTLKQLSVSGKPGSMAYHFLAKLIKALPLSPEERASFGLASSNKRAKTTGSSPESQFSSVASSASNEGLGPSVPRVDTPDVVAVPPLTDAPQLPFELASEFPPGIIESSGFGDLSTANFENLSANDFGGLETVWDWQSLNIDFTQFNNEPQ